MLLSSACTHPIPSPSFWTVTNCNLPRGTNRHEVKTFNVDGTYLSTYEPYSSFLHHNRSSPIASTAFHPHRTMLACAALNDHHINIVSC